jgi:tRNA pseudouridine55 synthase
VRPGLYLVHKRVGETSFSHVQRALEDARARTGRHVPVVHGGALDPFAEGLLVLLVGPATRLMDFLHPLPKRYVATIAWGRETDSGDLHGREVARGDASGLTPESLEAALKPFLGWTEQVPPAHSNKRVGGERAYLRVMRGETVELPPSRVYLHEARWLEHKLPDRSMLELSCRGGYYVRSLARDLGRALGARAHLTALARTGIGPWNDLGPDERREFHGRDVLPWCATRELTDHELGELRAGREIERGQVAAPRWTLPRGFPDPEAPISAVHQDRVVALLRGVESLSAGAIFKAGL